MIGPGSELPGSQVKKGKYNQCLLLYIFMDPREKNGLKQYKKNNDSKLAEGHLLKGTDCQLDRVTWTGVSCGDFLPCLREEVVADM